ncbi:MAG: hypothetical protein AAF569_00550 [Pseudomonadota bacterium]
MSHSDQLNLLQDFNTSSGVTKSKKKKSKTTSISVRVTEEEKATLQAMAGTMALAHFIRKKALGDDAENRAKQHQVKPRTPSVDSKEIARLLGMFGQSELATSMLALSLAATQGNIDVTPELEDKIESACDDIHTIKLALILALNVKPQGS